MFMPWSDAIVSRKEEMAEGALRSTDNDILKA
jgi:hypothetical protein